jgi:glycyl-tRNA synthetase|tara:strand:- start:13776 stop:15314 length:1539 start_codon:yes stop_codon:yes gene_type:complete
MSEEKFKRIISHAKEYGFIFQSSEIYDGLSAVYDYGQNGVLLKNNIKNYWWKSMVQFHENIVGIDSAIFTHPTTWKASGHIDAFNDPLIDNKDSKKRYRADNLIEDYILKIESKILKEQKKQFKRFGDSFDEKTFFSTNPKVLKYKSQIKEIYTRFSKALNDDNLTELKKIIEDCDIVCPISGSKNWTDVKQFNLMFKTQLGANEGSSTDLFLRPETAQGIFLNYLNVQKTGRMKIPFGIAQIGKAFRNEIVARQFIFRMREFEQMEMQFFIKPGSQKDWYEHWKKQRLNWHLSLGIDKNLFRFHDHEKLAHYADAACDIEFNFPFGFKELEGIHSRTDFDLSNHEKYSTKQIKYFDPADNSKFTPYVLETSIGLDRMFLAIFSSSLVNEQLDNKSVRALLKVPSILAPYKCAFLPLLKKDGLPELTKKIQKFFKLKYSTIYDEKDAIGRRYRRQDAIGTPFCITIDHQTVEDNTLTIRERDSMNQERIHINKLEDFLRSSLDINNWLLNSA